MIIIYVVPALTYDIWQRQSLLRWRYTFRCQCLASGCSPVTRGEVLTQPRLKVSSIHIEQQGMTHPPEPPRLPDHPASLRLPLEDQVSPPAWQGSHPPQSPSSESLALPVCTAVDKGHRAIPALWKPIYTQTTATPRGQNKHSRQWPPHRINIWKAHFPLQVKKRVSFNYALVFRLLVRKHIRQWFNI